MIKDTSSGCVGMGKFADEGHGGHVLGAVVGSPGRELSRGEFSGSDTKNQLYRIQRYEADRSYTQPHAKIGYS